MTNAPVPAARGGVFHGRLKLAVTVLLAVASVGYMARALEHSRESLRDIDWLARPGLLALGIVIQLISLSVGCRIWWMVLQRIAPNSVTASEHWRIWAITNPTRYVPGRIWHIASLSAMLRGSGISPVATLTSIVAHMWFFGLAALVAGLAVLSSLSLSSGAQLGLAVGVAVIVAAGTHPFLLGAVMRFTSRLTAQPALDWRGSWFTALAFVAMNVGVHLLAGLSVSVLLVAAVGMPPQQTLHVTGANALAFLAGYLSFVPAGLGVREAALTMFLSQDVPGARAVAAAVVVRGAAIVAELLLALLAAISGRRQWPVTGA